MARTCVPALAALIAGACSSNDGGPPEEVVIADVDTVVSLESELLATPLDLDVHENGTVFVIDYQMAYIVAIPGDGETPVVLGAEGQGPGEFTQPLALTVTDDTLRVVDAGNGRIQVLNLSGEYVRSYALPVSTVQTADLSHDGRAAIATMGFQVAALARTFDANGQPLDSIGELLAPVHEVWDLTAIQNAIAAGEIPATFRNWALPVWASDGGLWLILLAEGEVRRFDRDGNLVWSSPLSAPELAQIRDHFFARNRELEGTSAFYPLTFVADAQPVRSELWLLLDTPNGNPNVVLVLDDEGRLQRRLVLSSLSEAERLAYDPRRRRLYLAAPSLASVFAAQVP
ncbi:MAG: hypothetical protein JSU87_11045 [Gemmatimonadota bacterium]|nr:MAG: hypothetical protein JSU87_11045 [Gemmatimonadota bacterium]